MPFMRRMGRGMIGRPVARTALVVGTASVVSHGVNSAMDNSAAQKQQAAAADQAALDSQAEIEQMQQQMAAMQAQQTQAAMAAQQPAAAAAPAAPANDLASQLQQLAALKTAGILTDQEFEEAKAKLLAG